MDFGIGYRWRSYESNLLLSVRLPDDGAVTADATTTTESLPPPKPKRPHKTKPAPAPPEPSSKFFWFR
jgi:hypothetical protein